jgi:TonB family protein
VKPSSTFLRIAADAVALSWAWLFIGACASAPAHPSELVIRCDQLFATAPEGTNVPQSDMPRLLNGDDVYRRVTWLYQREVSRRAVVQLLVQPDGTVSHGCVRTPSGDAEFDQAALQSAEVARFRPAQLNGAAVDAWVTFPITIGM